MSELEWAYCGECGGSGETWTGGICPACKGEGEVLVEPEESEDES